MKKLLIICGPTATGKTRLALKLAGKFSGEIVSADSRQVYKHMDIGTGKDIPVNSKFEIRNSKLGGVYKVDGVYIWGYDLVGPKEEFSVAHYTKIATKVIDDVWKRGNLPVLVGGTGLYIKAVVDGIETVSIPKDINLRRSLEKKSVSELFEMLSGMDPIKSASMNMSDSKNPRRLIRAIEIAQFKLKRKSKRNFAGLKPNSFFIGLTAPQEYLNEEIIERVKRRIDEGIEKEIEKLLKMGVSWDMQSMQSLGYKQWRGYLIGKSNKDETIKEWIKGEINYAKRQNTWFKKDERIQWFDISKKTYRKGVETKFKKWYSQK